MVAKSNCVGLRGKGQEKRIQAPERGNGRRKFLTTVAAGAIAALVPASLAAQEKKPFKLPGKSGANDPWKAVVGEGGASMRLISKEEVERLLENAKKKEVIGGSSFSGGPHIGSRPLDMYENSSFKYSLTKESGRVFFEINCLKTNEKEVIVLLKEEETLALSRFRPKGNPRIAEELMVMATCKKMLVWFFDAEIKKLVLLQFSVGNRSGDQKFGATSPWSKDREKVKSAWGDSTANGIKIGYENKSGEITVISAQEKMAEGDKVFGMKINKDGEVISTLLECSHKSFTVPNPY